MVLAPVAAIATTRVVTVAAITPITAITAQAEAAAQPEAGISPRVGCSLLHAAATTAAGHSIVGGRHRAEAELLLWWEVATVAEAIAGLDDLLLLTLHLRRQVVAAFDSGAYFAGLFADLMDRREGGGQPHLGGEADPTAGHLLHEHLLNGVNLLGGLLEGLLVHHHHVSSRSGGGLEGGGGLYRVLHWGGLQGGGLQR